MMPDVLDCMQAASALACTGHQVLKLKVTLRSSLLSMCIQACSQDFIRAI